MIEVNGKNVKFSRMEDFLALRWYLNVGRVGKN